MSGPGAPAGGATGALVLTVFGAVHLGMALGRWPGLGVDRTAIALLSALVLCGGGAQDAAAVLAAIDSRR